ncbi:hypothetical protein DL96DRAFT_1560101 [Flagelloscypha sp. PMI_526]|nr:hypothetical protein DL96DRAFT_1560101 [Flagelloscypha sp. PMI_526]
MTSNINTTTTLPPSLEYLRSILIRPLATLPSVSQRQLAFLKSNITQSLTDNIRTQRRSQWRTTITVSATMLLPPPLFFQPIIASGIKWTKWRDALKLPLEGEATFVATPSKVAVWLPSCKCEMILWKGLEEETEGSTSEAETESTPSEFSSSSEEEDELPRTPPPPKDSGKGFNWPPVRSGVVKVEVVDGETIGVLSGGVMLSANPKNGYPRVKPAWMS